MSLCLALPSSALLVCELAAVELTRCFEAGYLTDRTPMVLYLGLPPDQVWCTWQGHAFMVAARKTHLNHGGIPVLLHVAHDLDRHIRLVLAIPALQDPPKGA